MIDDCNNITPLELYQEIQGEGRPKILDVREAFELDISKLEIDSHIPIAEIPIRWRELDPKEDWVVVCRSGQRSGKVTDFLRSQGFRRVRNLVTGMNGWAQTVDPTVKQY